MYNMRAITKNPLPDLDKEPIYSGSAAVRDDLIN